MSTEPSITRHDSAEPGNEIPNSFVPKTGERDPVPASLVDQTKSEIRQLVAEITELSQANLSDQAFFEGFLNRVTTALAAAGGAVWLNDPHSDQLRLEYQINVPPTCLPADSRAQPHDLLLKQVASAGSIQLVPPQSGSGRSSSPGNPCEFLLIFSPIRVEQRVVGLLEIFQRPGADPATQNGYLRFASQVCELASKFFQYKKLRSLSEQQELWQNLEPFVETIHRGLDIEQTVYHIANESRRFIGCDRVSVALQQGNACHVRAVSGLDSIERRADQVKKLGGLASVVNLSGEPLWYDGDADALPPQIRQPLDDYIALAHPRMLAIIPLLEVNPKNDPPGSQPAATQPIGALVIEQLKESRVDHALQRRTDVVVQHSQTALTNAIRYHRVFLLPVWQMLGRVRDRFRSDRRAKTLTCLGLAAGLLAFFTLMPFPFHVGSSGQLMPQSQHQVFAQVDGVLQEIFVSEENLQEVQAGQVLARMTNNDLMVQIQNLQGQINQMREQRRKFERAMHERMEPIDDIMIEGERIKTEQAEISLRRELDLKLEQARKLEILCPANGQITNWKVRQNLLGRPVEKGQALMTIVDPETTWQVELEVPERRMGHLIKRLQQNDESPTVEFTLASFPGRRFVGKLKSVDLKMEVYSDAGNSALALVEFDNEQVPIGLLRSGTRASANIHCGTESIGYVWFHEFFETVQATYMKWF